MGNQSEGPAARQVAEHPGFCEAKRSKNAPRKRAIDAFFALNAFFGGGIFIDCPRMYWADFRAHLKMHFAKPLVRFF